MRRQAGSTPAATGRSQMSSTAPPPRRGGANSEWQRREPQDQQEYPPRSRAPSPRQASRSQRTTFTSTMPYSASTMQMEEASPAVTVAVTARDQLRRRPDGGTQESACI